MINSRSRGADYEREIADALSDIFPDAQRNWQGQADQGGQDLTGTGIFALEIKGGKQANIATIRQWLNQAKEEAPEGSWDVVIARPHRRSKYGGDNYVIMDWSVFMEILSQLKAEGVI